MAAHRNHRYDPAVERYEGGETLREIADSFGVHHRVVEKALKRRGCQMRTGMAERQKQGVDSRLYRGGKQHKNSAAVAVRRAIVKSFLIRGNCEICGADDVVAHHDDYAKPLTVRWLCHKHHHEWHRHNQASNGRS